MRMDADDHRIAAGHMPAELHSSVGMEHWSIALDVAGRLRITRLFGVELTPYVQDTLADFENKVRLGEAERFPVNTLERPARLRSFRLSPA